MKKITVSVGIAVLNEEKNIKNLLDQILSQSRTNWILKEILISSDGSSDQTVNIVKKYNNKNVVLNDYKQRKGKVYRINQLFKMAKGDIFLMLDGDIILQSASVISNIVNEFVVSDEVTVVGANCRALEGSTFFEKAIYASLFPYYKSRDALKGGHNIFGSNGAGIAVRDSFAKKTIIPGIINEDDFLYLECIKNGEEFRCAKNAVINYRLPQNLHDYLKQFFRSNEKAVKAIHAQSFQGIIDDELYRPKHIVITSLIRAFFHNPLGLIYISIIRVIILPVLPFVVNNYKLSWYRSDSTK